MMDNWGGLVPLYDGFVVAEHRSMGREGLNIAAVPLGARSNGAHRLLLWVQEKETQCEGDWENRDRNCDRVSAFGRKLRRIQ